MREFFRETSSDADPADDTSPQNPAASQHNDVTQPVTTADTTQVTIASNTADNDGDCGRSGGYRHKSSSSASTTWIAFKVCSFTRSLAARADVLSVVF